MLLQLDTSSMQDAASAKLTGHTLACAVPLVADAFAVSQSTIVV